MVITDSWLSRARDSRNLSCDSSLNSNLTIDKSHVHTCLTISSFGPPSYCPNRRPLSSCRIFPGFDVFIFWWRRILKIAIKAIKHRNHNNDGENGPFFSCFFIYNCTLSFVYIKMIYRPRSNRVKCVLLRLCRI